MRSRDLNRHLHSERRLYTLLAIPFTVSACLLGRVLINVCFKQSLMQIY